ncbi:ATPase [Colletotrichum nymphaeae SA-01]|uniref:ATPase n=1 Tax=Colletotrichum nymphaeae SA-01 TaxID=1460502 RepID=A0A135SXD2_9PEZI|nr:ATPase [Colletotrichum nymphaeae SA-01]
MHSGSDISPSLSEADERTNRSYQDSPSSDIDESPAPSIHMTTQRSGSRKKSDRSAPPREINQFGVGIRHTTIRSYRDRQGRFKTVQLVGVPSKDEKHIDPAQIPGVTFYHRVDAFKKVWPDRIEVDWWEFSDFLKGLEPFPFPERPTSRGIAFYPPYATLFLRLDALERELSIAQPNSTTSGNTTASAHNLAIAKTILDFLKPTFDETRSKLEALNSSAPGTLVQYDDLWLLYKPGDFIFYRVSELETVCYVVDYPIIGMPASVVYEGLLQVKCWSIEHNSQLGVFSKRHFLFQLDRSQGGSEIARLLYVPARFMEDLDAVKAFTVSRGKSYWEMNTTSRFQQVTTSKQHSHDQSSGMRVIVGTEPESTMNEGQLLRGPSPSFDKHAAITKWSAEAVMGSVNFQTTGFDVETANIRTAPPEVGKIWSTWFRDYEAIPPTAKPDELVLMLCSRDVTAFSLREKRWGWYNVVDLEPVQFAVDAWKRLVLKAEYKEVIWAMVKSYLAHSTNFHDLVDGKGEGLVILLHGPPGVGKTLTAECVAESFKKPLYMVTAGDLGTDPETLEGKLSKIFDHAEAWDAILLLDEADIFLQDRDYDNLQRNALVSIFLRTLEYFNGIMFLTSNRIGAFDQAFQSRIHITIGMPEFDEPLRKEVWKIFIQDLGRKRRDGSPALLSREECKALGSEVTKSWASQPLNGRQIRNCVRSALALAEDKGVKPDASHFNKVLKLGNAFTQYMTKLQKAEAEEIAQIKGDRLAAMKDIMAQSDAA